MYQKCNCIVFCIASILAFAISACYAKTVNMPTVKGSVMRPRISGDWIVAVERDSDDKQLGVIVYSISKKKVYTVYDGSTTYPSIYNNTIVFSTTANVDGKTGNINKLTFFDLSTGTLRHPSVNTKYEGEAVISGENVVYESGAKIYLYNSRTNAQKILSPVEQISRNPSINGDLVVWREDKDSQRKECRVHCYKLSTGEDTVITPEYCACYTPVTDGKYVIWWNDDGVIAFDTTNNAQSVISKGFYPAVDNSIVVYLKRIGGPAQNGKCNCQAYVYGTNLITGKEFKISQTASDGGPAIDKGRVVWYKGNVVCYEEIKN